MSYRDKPNTSYVLPTDCGNLPHQTNDIGIQRGGRFDAFSPAQDCGTIRRYNRLMADVTQILSQIEQGDPSVTEQLLPMVYDELHKLAAAKMAFEKPGQNLQATALVNEAHSHRNGSLDRQLGSDNLTIWYAHYTRNRLDE